MAAAGPGISLGSNALGTINEIKGIKLEQEAQVDAARSNAAMLQMQRDAFLEDAKAEQQLFADQSEIMFGEQVSSMAKAGVDVGSGSPMLNLVKSKTDIENQAQLMRTKTRREREIFDMQIAAQLRAASRARSAGVIAERGAVFKSIGDAAKPVGTLLGP